MLNTVLFDMGGTLEDVRYSEETIRLVTEVLMDRLRAYGLQTNCTPAEFWEKVEAGVKRYKRWSEPAMLEKKPEEIWADYYLAAFDFDREVLLPIAEELGDLWERTYYHRELRPGVRELLDALKRRGYHLGVVSNNASLYNVFNVLEEYGIRSYMEDVTVSSVVGYRKPHREIFNIALRQMQVTAGECVYVGDTISRDIIGAKRAGFGKAVQIASFLATKKDIHLPPDAEKPDVVIENFEALLDWLDRENPAMALQ
ncbi:MAG: HAD family hydrolase [Oscillibacter sp.]